MSHPFVESQPPPFAPSSQAPAVTAYKPRLMPPGRCPPGMLSVGNSGDHRDGWLPSPREFA